MKNPRIVIEKNKRRLLVFDGEKLIAEYRIALGSATAGDKELEGDGKTPEGEFYVAVKNEQSKFHRSLGLSYPNFEAAERGLKENLLTLEEYEAILQAIAENRVPPQKTRLGGEIYIHGGGIESDWTKGCVALKNEEIRALFDSIPIGAKVKIMP